MGYLRRAGVAAGAVATLMIGTAAPVLAGNDNVKVSPYRVEPGDSVRLTTGGCPKADEMIATSDAFEDAVELGPDGDVWEGDADISWDADPGSYEVEVSCDDEADALSGSFVVVDGWGPDTGGGGLALSGQNAQAESGQDAQAGSARDVKAGSAQDVRAVSAEVGTSASFAWGIGGVALAGALAAGLIVVRRRVRMRG